MIKVGSINFYRSNHQPLTDTVRINKLDLDVIGFQEIWNHLEQVDRAMPNHKLYHARRETRASREVAVGLRKGSKLLGWHGQEVSDLEPGEETSIFKSRWITVVRFLHDGKKFAVINYHGNAVVQDKNTGGLLHSAGRVKEWLEAAREIQKTIKRLQDAGFLIIVTGDFNYRRFPWLEKFHLAFWSPQRTFKRTGLKWVENHLDYIAWSKELKKEKYFIVPKHLTGADHDWLVVHLT